MNNVRIKRFFALTLLLFVAGVLFVISIMSYVRLKYAHQIFQSITTVPTSTYAIVLGAALKPDGTASDALTDRLITAEQLYRSKKISKILVTGDGGALRSNEVAVMKDNLLKDGIPEQDLLIDTQGYRTYESCKRAKEIYFIDKAIIITQNFHLPRSLYLCESFGISSTGISADRHTYVKIFYFTLRDFAASFKAWLDIHFLHPKAPV